MRTLLTAATLCLVASSSYGVVLVDDTFTDTDRIGGSNGATTTSSSPSIGTATSSNTQWTANRVSQLVASGSGLLWTMDTNSRLITGTFPTVSLAAGTITTFTVNFTTGAMGVGTTNNLRVALTNGTPNGFRATDGVGTTDATYVDDVGYGFFSGNNTGGTAPAPNLSFNTRQRVLTTSNNLLGTAGEWSASIGSSSGATGNFAGETAYAMTFAFDYTGTETTITTSITGGNFAGMSFQAVDSADLVTAFNQFTFRLGGGSNQFAGINFTGFAVDQVSAVVPEPSAYAAIAGLGMLGFAASRRRRLVRA